MGARRGKDGLTDKQRQFIKEYLIDKNATQAAIRAGYSKRTAFSMGVENLNKPIIATKLQQGLEKLQYKADISAQRVLLEEKCLSQVDPGELCRKDGTLIPINELPEHVRRAVAGFEVTETPGNNGDLPTRKWKYKFWDKGRSLERISKHLGLYEADNAQKAISVQVLNVLLAGLPQEIAGPIRDRLMGGLPGLPSGGKQGIVEVGGQIEAKSGDEDAI